MRINGPDPSNAQPDEWGERRFFAGFPASRAIYEAVWAAAQELGPVGLRVTKSQVALLRVRPFAWVWIPQMYLRGNKAAPLVLSFSFAEPRPWPRWKEIYQAARGRYTHHLELRSAEEVDDGVREWLAEAWRNG